MDPAVAVMSLHAIAHTGEYGDPFSSALVADLWPRVWEWIRFLHEYRGCIASLPRNAPDAYIAYASIIRRFGHQASDVIDSTPGITILLTAVWKVLLGAGGPAKEASYEETSSLLFRLHTRAPGNLAEMLEGAGGTLNSLASILVTHMRCVTLIPQSPVSAGTLICMSNAGALLGDIADQGGPVHSALISCGIIKAEVAALCSFTHLPHSPDFIDDYIEGIYLPQLLNMIEVPPGCSFELLFTMGKKQRVLHRYVHELLKKVLPESTMHYSVLPQLRQSLVDVQDIAESSSFKGSDVFADRINFVDLAHERLAIMDCYDAGGHSSPEKCQNQLVSLFAFLLSCGPRMISAQP